MPWTCTCGASVSTDDAPCACGARKSSWSVVANRTRAFVVASKSFDVLRGVGASPLRAGDTSRGVVQTVRTDFAWAVENEVLARIAARGLVPAPQHVHFVRLMPHKSPKDLEVEVSILHQERESAEVLVPSPDDGWIDVPMVFGYGPGKVAPDVFPGLTVVDVSEPSGGHVPEVEVTALKRPARRLPVKTGIVPRFVEAGPKRRPVAGTYLYLAPAEGRVDDAEACVTDADGFLGRPDGEGWQRKPPTEHVRRLEGERARVHWSYSPVERAALARLPARAWSSVTIAEEVALRPAKLRGGLWARLVAPDGEALANAAYALRGPDGRALEGTTDGDGVLRHESVALVTWLLEMDGRRRGLVEAGGLGDAPVDVLLPAPPRARDLTGVTVLRESPDDDAPEEDGDDDETPDEDDEDAPDDDDGEGWLGRVLAAREERA